MTRDEFDQRVHSAVGGSIDELIEEVRFLSVEYGKQKNHVEDLEHFRKSLIAKLMEEHRERIREHNKTAKTEDKEKATEGRLENLARFDKRYEEFLQTLRSEKDKLTVSEAEYYALRNKLEALIEQMKFVRSEMYFTQTA